ncbi:MAG: exodeoxyribonuclease V subunit gamma, partial [Chromatiaceae bacterium]|nr:exodeoxyribonuclease V subunit gamma [Candidatus Thioaporhodococcus sediminis]
LMCVHNPCEHYWADILADQELLRAEHRRQRRRVGMPDKLAAEELHQHAHPLLAAWGKQGRDFIGLLDEHDDATARGLYAARFHAIGQRIDLFDPPRDPSQATTLLAQLQDDIRDLRPLAESRDRWPPVDPARDLSLRFHIAHGPQREVEILHDQLLAAFNADPSLTPRDVIVMVPDIDAYAPHIQAVFGLVDRQDPRYIPFSLADQGRRATDPLVQALASLLELPQSRLAVSDLLDLLEVPALRRRFGISAEDLPRLHRWVRGANIRWGLHAAQRASLELPDQPEDQARHTWRFGLRRMLLGYAVGQDAAAWRGIEPFDEIGGLDAALLGPLTRLLDRLDATWRTLREPASVADWCARLRQLLADFLDAGDSSEDAFTLLQLETALQDWLEAGEEAGLTEKLPLSIVGEHWLSRLDEGGLSQRFFAGAVTFATLMPMRAIPFRLICLLGMNDGDYPRQRPPLDFDLMGQDYRPGDRSRREDDRYLFLEALLSARERLYLSWVGRRITDNSPRPPSVLVGQLRDHLAAGWRLADADCPEEARHPTDNERLSRDFHANAIPQGLVPSSVQGLAPDSHPGPAQTSSSLLDALTQEHPLQPFSLRYFPSDPAASHWFTYAREWRPGVAMSEPPGRVTADGGRHESIPGGLTTASRRSTPPSAVTRPSPPSHNLMPAGDTGAASDPELAGQAPLPPFAREEPLRLRDLADFLKAPVKAFFTQRLGVYFDGDDPAAEDQEPFSLDHLQRWLLNDELIQAQARAVDAGEPLAEVRAARLASIRRRGDLAPGGFGEAIAEELEAPMDKLFAEYREALGRWPQPIAQEMEILFPAQTEDQSGDQPGTQTLAIADWLGGLRADAAGQRGRVVLETSDLVKDRHYRGEKVIRHWVAHLAGNLGEGPLTTLVLSKVGKVELAPLPPDQARRHLAELLRAWDEGLRRPLPLATRTA